MADGSGIEWTDATWNPVVGCTPVSPGCLNCYAARLALRLASMPNGVGQKYRGTAKRAQNGRPVFTGLIRVDEHALLMPSRWRSPRRVFVNSMSDLFHEDVPREFIGRVFGVMQQNPQHTFQILTKRPERAAELAPSLHWPANVWMGTSIESDRYYVRIDHLRSIPAAIRFLSCEPLLGPLKGLPLTGIHWVIVGGESGPAARPMERHWVRDIKRQCRQYSAAFFFKQWGGTNKKRTGRDLDGRTWDELPRVKLTVSIGA
jgi:protein gp37